MALIMIRQNPTNAAPPLPARHPPSAHQTGQSATDVKSGRSQSVDHTAQGVHHVRMVRQYSDGTRSEVRQPEEIHMRANPVSRRGFETKYEDCPAPPPIATLPRTAKKSSDQKNSAGGAPPPPTKSPPAKKPDPPPTSPPGRPPKGVANEPSPGRPPKAIDQGPVRPPKTLAVQPERPPKTIQSQIQSPVADQVPARPAKPSPVSPGAVNPPARPPKVVKSPSVEKGLGDNNPCMYDLERRFYFHDLNEFPPPEPMSGVKKTRPTMTNSMRRQDQTERMGFL